MPHRLAAIFLLIAALPAFAVQYSGGAFEATFVTTTGTRAEMANGIIAALLAHGWTYVSGAGADQTLISAATPAGLRVRARIYDPGSGNCARIVLSNADGVKAMTTFFPLLPTAGETVRVMGNQYQFFVFAGAGATSARKYAMGGVPWTPSFLSLTECVWGISNGANDTDANNKSTFRLGPGVAGYNGTQIGYQWLDVNGATFEGNSGNIWQPGQLTLVSTEPVAYVLGSTTGTGYLWQDNSMLVSDVYLAMNPANTALSAQIVGMLWDTVLISDNLTLDATMTWDGRNWRCYSQPQTASIATAVTARGQLCHVIP
jgi:hypothetical protein